MGIETSTVLSAPREQVFAWHTRPGALQRVLPPWVPMSVAQESGSLADGTAVVELPGGVKWTAHHRLGDYQEGHRFVDESELPLTRSRVPWRHEHLFEDVPGGTRVIDRITTPVPSFTVRPALAYRYRQLAGDFAVAAELRELAPDPLTIGMTGSSGLLGSALAAFLSPPGIASCDSCAPGPGMRTQECGIPPPLRRISPRGSTRSCTWRARPSRGASPTSIGAPCTTPGSGRPRGWPGSPAPFRSSAPRPSAFTAPTEAMRLSTKTPPAETVSSPTSSRARRTRTASSRSVARSAVTS